MSAGAPYTAEQMLYLTRITRLDEIQAQLRKQSWTGDVDIWTRALVSRGLFAMYRAPAAARVGAEARRLLQVRQP